MARDANVADAPPASPDGDAGAFDAGADAASALTDAGVDASSACKPVRKYTYTLASDRALQCVPGNAFVSIFDQAVPDQGRALARVTFSLAGAGGANLGLHGWSAQMGLGDPGFAGAIAYGVGEDLCPGEALSKRWLMFGDLVPGKDRVRVDAAQYRSSACQNGVVVVKAGSTLEVWVEDAQVACQGKDIRAASYFQKIFASAGPGANQPVSLGTNLTSMVSLSLTTQSSARHRVLGHSEISPASTSNTCGNRVETAVSFLSTNGAYTANDRAGYPTSGGQTHVLLSPEHVAEMQPPGTYTFGIAAAVDQVAQVGALAGTTVSGDTVVAVIVER